jgi:hypothetical protein
VNLQAHLLFPVQSLDYDRICATNRDQNGRGWSRKILAQSRRTFVENSIFGKALIGNLKDLNYWGVLNKINNPIFRSEIIKSTPKHAKARIGLEIHAKARKSTLKDASDKKSTPKHLGIKIKYQRRVSSLRRKLSFRSSFR